MYDLRKFSISFLFSELDSKILFANNVVSKLQLLLLEIQEYVEKSFGTEYDLDAISSSSSEICSLPNLSNNEYLRVSIFLSHEIEMEFETEYLSIMMRLFSKSSSSNVCVLFESSVVISQVRISSSLSNS